MKPRARALAIGGSCSALVVVVLAARPWRLETPPQAPREDPPDAGVIAWCAPGLEAIPGGGCFSAAREGGARPAPLLVYLHGRYDRAAPEQELERQKRVAERAARRGFAVLALRGRLGQCLDPELSNWFCWPASEKSVAAAAPLVASWEASLRETEARLGGRGPRYVLGFSSGGFFTAILASRALFDADGFVIAHAGPIEPMRPAGRTPPLLLLSADDDVPTQDDMMRLDDTLTRLKWPHDAVARGGGHALTDGDIEAALSFLSRAKKERLPLRPPLSTHVPRARDPSRGVDAEAAPEAEATPDPAASAE